MKMLLTDNVVAEVKKGMISVEVVIEGGHTDHAPIGWAYVLADRLVARGLEPRVQVRALGEPAHVLLNGRVYDQVCECVKEIA